MPREAHCFTWMEDFQGKEITHIQATTDYSQYNPIDSALIAQDNLEQEMDMLLGALMMRRQRWQILRGYVKGI